MWSGISLYTSSYVTCYFVRYDVNDVGFNSFCRHQFLKVLKTFLESYIFENFAMEFCGPKRDVVACRASCRCCSFFPLRNFCRPGPFLTVFGFYTLFVKLFNILFYKFRHRILVHKSRFLKSFKSMFRNQRDWNFCYTVMLF